MKQIFNNESFLKGETVINCRTRRDAESFLKEIGSINTNLKWVDGTSVFYKTDTNTWDSWNSDTIYGVIEGKMICLSLEYKIDSYLSGSKTIEYSEISIVKYLANNRNLSTGDMIFIIDGTYGATGANGHVGVITQARSTSGLRSDDTLNVLLDTGVVWSVSKNGKYVRISQEIYNKIISALNAIKKLPYTYSANIFKVIRDTILNESCDFRDFDITVESLRKEHEM